MPKRKRPSPSPEPSDSETPGDRLLARQKKRCTHILAATQKSLVSALRLGAGFERQKFSRRRKTAKEKKDDKAVARLDAEYAALKSLDIPKVAEQHLRKTIAKVKTLREHEGLPDSVREIEKSEKDTATLNTLARLYKVQGVKKTVDTCIDDLKAALGLAVNESVKGGRRVQEDDALKKKAKVESQDEDVPMMDGDADGTAFAEFDACIAAPSSADEDSDDSLELGNRPPSVADNDSEGEDEDELDTEDDSDEAKPRNDYVYSGGESDEDQPPAESKTKAKAKTKVAEKVSSSTFLPSLSHAGYVSGSESEAEDLDIDIAPKKNRRGQRARQKIWEKKFGDKAKHKAKEERNKGWDPKRGAVSDDRSGRGGRMNTGRGPQISGENAIALGSRKQPTKRDDTGSLHPSWQAAKAAKEKKLMAKPEGKKIVFD